MIGTDTDPADVTADRSLAAMRPPPWLAIGLACLAGLLLEVAYTRIISYKLWYYYTYLVIGLSLLGIGFGGILVSICRPLRAMAVRAIVATTGLFGAVATVGGYWAIARLPLDTVAIWDYGTGDSFENLALLGLLCATLFLPFIGLGVLISTLLGRAGPAVGRLYFADLVGAGLGCVLAIPLISVLSPPQVVLVSACAFGVIGVLALPRRPAPALAVGVALVAVLALGAADEDRLPNVRVEESKISGEGGAFTEWGPVFRVDVVNFGVEDLPNQVLLHDGTWGSGIWEFDGDVSSLDRYETDSRAIPFDVLGAPPDRELIIGSAGGQEILASLYRGAADIEAVELNPVTVSLLTDHFADYTGRLPERPDVRLHQGDGRTYLARSDRDYDLVWFVAPDSYAASNAASSGAFVLSESYLYTRDMIEETLRHLTDDGVMVVQFGELDFETEANRTSRYVVTARDALRELGVEDPSRHLLVAAEVNPGIADFTTIVVKRTPLTDEEIQRFTTGLDDIRNHQVIHADGVAPGSHVVTRLAGGTSAEVDEIVAGADRSIDTITDDAPFFWHFNPFPSVLADVFEPIDSDIDPEDSIGERVMLLLLVVAVALAAVFLLVPFVLVRRTWSTLPAKGSSAVYFAALGTGFMLFEITMIQRLVRFLGYPTYSLTVTLASILVFTGLGALLSNRLAERFAALLPVLLAVLAGLTLAYRFGLDEITDGLQSASLGVRVAVAVVALAPLGLCLGMFMPVGLRLVGRVADGEVYVAWSWAVNGFFSVIGSVLTTILSMEVGFRMVQLLALAVYAVAALALVRLRRSIVAPASDEPWSDEPVDGDRVGEAAALATPQPVAQ